MTRTARRVLLKYMVSIPIPVRDRAGKLMPKARRTKWQRAAHRLLTRLYGGATSVPTLGSYQYDNKRVRYEPGQVLVWAACKNKEAYLAHQAEIEAWAEEMAYDLDQESVLIAAHPAHVTLRYARRGR